MERHELDWEQMHWRQWKIRNDLEGSERRFRQEFPIEAEEAFLTTGNPVFSPEVIRDLTFDCLVPEMQGEILLVNE